MNIINNSEEILTPLSSALKNLNIIDLEKLKTEDIVLINKNIDDYHHFFTTQQANYIDYDKFSNHVFFDSAVNKVSYCFNKLLNFPYDVDEFNHKNYVNKLEGYVGHIYKNVYPKNKSFISFDSNQKVLIKNKKSAFLNELDYKEIGPLCPKKRFSFNFWLKVHSNNFTENQVIFKFFNENNNSGFICYVSSNNNGNSKYYINFLLINNSNFSISKTEIDLNVFQNITINVSSISNRRIVSFLVNGNKVENASSGNDPANIIDDAEFDVSLEEISTNFIIGSSESLSVTLNASTYNFTNFNGYIDEFRYYHKIKSIKETKREIHKNIYSQNGLILYLKFNEPGGNYLNSYVCLDSSGNKLHGIILNNNNQIIEDTTSLKISNNTPLKLERLENSPVINSKFSNVVTLREELLQKAKEYDKKNKNIIFNLMPKHYFLEASDYQNLPIFSSEDTIQNDLIPTSKENYPTTNTFESSQPANNHFVNIVLIWARFFDQLKIMIDSISHIVDVDYEAINKKRILGLKIPLICKLYGIDFVELFDSTTKRKKDKEALNFEDIINDLSIRQIQNEIWYKILINSRSFLQSKGTLHSIDQVMSSVGISYSDNIIIREYSTVNNLENIESQYSEFKIKYLGVNFTNRKLFTATDSFENSSSFSNLNPYLEVSNLKHFTSEDKSIFKDFIIEDNNIKSGLGNNFSIELYFNIDSFLKNKKNIESIILDDKNTIKDINSVQNILRIDYDKSPVLNLYFTRKNIDSNLFTLTANIKPIINSHLYNFTLTIEDIDLFSRENYLCITQNVVGSNITYSLYCNKANSNLLFEDIKSTSQTKSINNIESSFFTSNQSNLNLRIGSYFYDNTTTQLFSLDNTSFQGEILNLRTWSKNLSIDEIKNHAKNIENISEDVIKETTLVNNFFLNKDIKSNEILTNNNVKYFNIKNNSIIKKKSDSSGINTCTFNIKNNNFEVNSFIRYNEFLIKNKNFNIDSLIKHNRVNIISYSKEENKTLSNNFNPSPSNSIPYDYIESTENRLSIDFSIVKAINDDISKLIVNISEFNELLHSNNIYNYSYKNIDKLRKDYFNRMKDDVYINYSSLANVFRYLDNILSSLLSEMIPSKTKFQGFNLVYESHILERHKYQHKNSDSRIGIYNKNEIYNFSRNISKSYRDFSYNKNRKMSET